MTASKILIEAIKKFEGCRLRAYRDVAGIPTIGYGHTSGVKMGQSITLQKAEQLLKDDLVIYEKFVNGLKVCKTQGQFDALVDFCYNLGCGSLRSSTLLKYIKANKPTPDIQAQFKRWCYSGKKKLPGLEKRRNWEANRWIDVDK